MFINLIQYLAASFLLITGGFLSKSNSNYDTVKTNHVILISIDGLAAYHLENDNLELPNLRELIDRGVWPDASQSIFPSVTHPSHATIITGVSPRNHGVVGNLMTNRETGETHHPTTQTRKEAIHARTLFDAAHEAGLTTAALCWPETRGDPSIDFNILHGHAELDPDEVDPGLLENLRQAGIPIDSYYDWAHQGRMVRGYQDALLAMSAAEIFKTHRPGFMAIHFLVTDGMQHGWGPDHYLSHGALSRADYNLGLIRKAVQYAGLEEQTTFIIVADHGFHSVYHEVNIHPVLKASGLADRIRLHGNRWAVFVETSENFDEPHDGEALETFFENLMEIEGIKQIIRNSEFHRLGYPRYEESPYVPGQFLIIPDIDTYIEVDPSSNSTDRRLRNQPSHAHGYLPDHPRMRPAMVLSGYGIRKEHRLGLVRNLDVAPTIAELLGLDMPDVEGDILWDALKQK